MYILRIKRNRTKSKRNPYSWMTTIQRGGTRPFRPKKGNPDSDKMFLLWNHKSGKFDLWNRNPRLWNQESHEQSESGIQVPLTPESSTWNPESRRGIHNPRLGLPYMGRTSKTKLDMELNPELCDNRTTTNVPLPSSKNLHFQNEAKCTTFLVKMSFIYIRMKNHFHIKGWALFLVLIQRACTPQFCFPNESPRRIWPFIFS